LDALFAQLQSGRNTSWKTVPRYVRTNSISNITFFRMQALYYDRSVNKSFKCIDVFKFPMIHTKSCPLQTDVLEELDNVILLQNVMEEVWRRNVTKYKRIRNGVKTKKWNYFLNEHHKYSIAKNICYSLFRNASNTCIYCEAKFF